ncbi:12571_t:CDS:2 [Entrophospora sp. SA101]|nr:12571_t:CDS:2 [Entrophospora sp. SA101]
MDDNQILTNVVFSVRDPVPEHIKKAITHKVLSKQRINTTTIKDRNEKVSRIILNEENNNNNGNVDEAFIITKIKELTTLKKNLFQKLHGEHFQSQIFIGNKRSKEQSSPSFGPSFNKRSRTLSASTSNGISNSNSGNMMMGRARDDQYPYYHRNDYRPGHPPYIDHHIPYGRGFLNNNNMSRRQSNAAPPLPSGRSTIPRSLDRSHLFVFKIDFITPTHFTPKKLTTKNGNLFQKKAVSEKFRKIPIELFRTREYYE